MNKLTSKIESLLFVAGGEIKLSEIAKILEISKKEARSAVQELGLLYKKENHGVIITTNKNSVELITAPNNANVIQKFKEFDTASMSSAKIETLAILGYKGPISKPKLENLRGVNCSLILKNLKIEGLIEELRVDESTEYIVSTKFLKGLGINSPEELPNYLALQ